MLTGGFQYQKGLNYGNLGMNEPILPEMPFFGINPSYAP